MKTKSPTLGVIYGNRDFFPDKLVSEARQDIAKLFKKLGVKAVQLGEKDSKLGGVETLKSVRVSDVIYVRHYSGIGATTRWGVGHSAGVIYLSSHQ